MRMTFPCESCGQTLHVSQRHAGKKAKCKHCGHVLTVPESGGGAEPAATDAEELELIAFEPAPPSKEESVAAAMREIVEGLHGIQNELVRFRKMIFRLIFWTLVLSIVLLVVAWWSADSLERRLLKSMDKSMDGKDMKELQKLLKDAGLQ
jgi:hypothetical protein